MDKHRAVKLRIARKRKDLVAVATLEADRKYTAEYEAPIIVLHPITESEMRALWGDR